MKNILTEQGFNLVDALEEFVRVHGGELRTGDEFVLSIRDVEGRLTDNGKPVFAKLCSSDFEVHTQARKGEGRKKNRNLSDVDKVYLPVDMCFQGYSDLSNVRVEVQSRGYYVSRGEKSTAWLRFNE